MKIFKDKEGNKLTFKEFMKKWGEGIEGISPLQKIKTQIGGTRIMLIGLFLGLCVSIYGWKNLWWVGIILIGALLNTGVQYLGLIQQRKILDNIEKQFAEPEEEFSKGRQAVNSAQLMIEQDAKAVSYTHLTLPTTPYV